MGTKNNPGEFDCYDKAEPDEPMFVLLARDPDAPRLVRAWAEGRWPAKPNDPHNPDMITEANVCAAQMEAWRKEHRP